MGKKMYHYTESGLDYIYLVNGYKYHTTKYGDGVSISNVDKLHESIALNVVEKPNKLTGQEIKFLRVELDLSQKRLGGILGVEDQTVARWEKNKVEIPQSHELVLRTFYKERISGKGEISEIISQITDMDQELTMLELKFKECDEGWCEAA